jgi:hypothetical protein
MGRLHILKVDAFTRVLTVVWKNFVLALILFLAYRSYRKARDGKYIRMIAYFGLTAFFLIQRIGFKQKQKQVIFDMYLMRDGMNVIVRDGNHKERMNQIKYFRPPSEDELKQIQMTGRLNVLRLMKMYYPILYTGPKVD